MLIQFKVESLLKAMTQGLGQKRSSKKCACSITSNKDLIKYQLLMYKTKTQYNKKKTVKQLKLQWHEINSEKLAIHLLGTNDVHKTLNSPINN